VFRAIAASLVVSVIVPAARPASAAIQTTPAPRATTTPDYTFETGTALLLFYVRPDRTADFEAVLARLSQALAASADPVRRQQAAAWRMMRSSEPSRDAVVYVFLLDPVVQNADYDPVRVLSESLPADVQPLYEKLKASVIRVERMALTKLR
jgi:hypothetical protein